MYKWSIFTLYGLILSLTATAQLNNRQETIDMKALGKLKRGLYFSVYNNNFFKNNEFFLPTVSGYTLFGTQNVLALTYKPKKHLSLQAGVYLKQDFGQDGLARIAPWYQLHLHQNGYSLTFGNLSGNIGHGLIDPLYAYERLMSHFQEQGIQLKADKKRIYTDLWVNWEKQQYYSVNYNERFSVGNHTRIKLWKGKHHRLHIPIQLLASHSGGQWDTTAAPTVTLFNAAAGLDWTWRLKKYAIRSVGLSAYYAYYKDLAGNSNQAYANGSGTYVNLNVQFRKGFYSTLGYWHGTQFIAPKGGILFQSVSANPNKPDLTAPERDLLSLGLAYQHKVFKTVGLDLRVEPFYDLGNRKLNYSYGLFLTYQPHFLLK